MLFLDGARSRYPATPGLSPDPDFQKAILTVDHQARPDGGEVPGRAPWKAPRPRRGHDHARASGSDRTSPRPARGGCSTSRPRRSGAPSRASCRCSTCSAYTAVGRQREEPGQLRAPDHHAGRRAGEPLRGRLAAHPRSLVAHEARLAGRAERAGAPHRAAPRRRDRHVRPDRRGGARGDRRRAAGAGRADPLRAQAAERAPQLLEGHHARPPDQVGGGLRHGPSGATTASAARRSPTGPANTTFDNTPPAGSPGSCSASSAATRRARSRSSSRSLAARRCSTTSSPTSATRPRPEAVVRDGLDAGGVDARLPGRAHRPRRAAPLRARRCASRRARPLGRHRDGRLLERLHGRRGALGRARRPRRCWGR